MIQHTVHDFVQIMHVTKLWVTGKFFFCQNI